MRIDHVAIAVNNVDQALKNYEKLIRVDKVHIENVANEKVKVAILDLQDTRIELMEPTAGDSPINKFLSQKIT
jgi:methylmalonyl-CoA/ethylmalonyl-CoA epimerase